MNNQEYLHSLTQAFSNGMKSIQGIPVTAAEVAQMRREKRAKARFGGIGKGMILPKDDAGTRVVLAEIKRTLRNLNAGGALPGAAAEPSRRGWRMVFNGIGKPLTWLPVTKAAMQRDWKKALKGASPTAH